MKIETKVLIASTIGLAAVFGITIFKKLFTSDTESNCYYDEFHKQFSKSEPKEELQHGVEYLSVL